MKWGKIKIFRGRGLIYHLKDLVLVLVRIGNIGESSQRLDLPNKDFKL